MAEGTFSWLEPGGKPKPRTIVAQLDLSWRDRWRLLRGKSVVFRSSVMIWSGFAAVPLNVCGGDVVFDGINIELSPRM